MPQNTLIIVTGPEGVGKSTIVRELKSMTPRGAMIDAEDLAWVNPWEMNEQLIQLIWKNVLSLIHNFWNAGYSNVIAGSFIDYYEQYTQFRENLPNDIDVYLIQLSASKKTRDARRAGRNKPYNKEESDKIDRLYPEETAFERNQEDYKYVRVDSGTLSIQETVQQIIKSIPEIYEQVNS